MKKCNLRIINEFNDFKKEILKLDKNVIFELSDKINFYNSVKNCIVDMQLDIKDETTLDNLWDYFLSYDDASMSNYDEIHMLILDYENDLEEE